MIQLPKCLWTLPCRIHPSLVGRHRYASCHGPHKANESMPSFHRIIIIICNLIVRFPWFLRFMKLYCVIDVA